MRARLLLSVPLGALAIAGCSSGDGAGSTTTAGCAQATGGQATLVAADLAFDVDCIDAEAGDLTIVLVNEDDGVNHNVRLPDLPGSPGTELRKGPATDELDVVVEAGEQEYVCDIHPNMVGTIRVAAAKR